MGLRRVERGRSFGHVNRVMVFQAFCIIVERDPASSATNCCSSVRVDCSGSRQIVSEKKCKGIYTCSTTSITYPCLDSIVFQKYNAFCVDNER